MVEELNCDSTGKQRQLYGYGISAKRYALYRRDGSKVQLIKPSERGFGNVLRPKERRAKKCDLPEWRREAWQWIIDRALGLPRQEPDWLSLPVMRRISITTPNVMAALRRLNRIRHDRKISPCLWFW